MSRFNLSVVSIVLSLSIVVVGQTQPEVWGCIMEVSYVNRARKVTTYGLDQECYRPLLGEYHSAPFGNWGVVSPYSGRWDGDQFPGWKQMGGHHQWNACNIDFPAPDSAYYNADSFTTQASTYQHPWGFPDGAAQHAWRWLDTREGYCDSYNGLVQTEEGHFMDLWELDPYDDDEFVGTLEFPTLSLEIAGCGETECYIHSDWVDQNVFSSPGLYAKFGFEISMRYQYLYGG